LYKGPKGLLLYVMEVALETVVIVVSVAAAVAAVVAYMRAGDIYRKIGRLGSMYFDTTDPESERLMREAIREEVRQQLEHERTVARKPRARAPAFPDGPGE
jgi:hypothetical protein